MALYALQPAAANRSEILKLFLARGMDPNKNLVDTRIMPSYGSLPPHFDEKLAPVGYGAWNKTFVGPADLWVVIRGAYAGSTDGDFDLLRLLAANGATMRTSLLFLKSYESIWGNTPVYWDVRKKVESLKGIAPSLPPPAARAVATAPTVETCGPSPLTKRPAEEFIGRWVSQVNLLYRTRNEQYRDLENLRQVQGRFLVADSGIDLYPEIIFTLSCLEKMGYLRVENFDPPRVYGNGKENRRIIFSESMMPIPY